LGARISSIFPVRSSQLLVPSFICGYDAVVTVAVKVIHTLYAADIVVAKMTLLEKKACPCPLDYPCHTFHLNIVVTIAMELVVIAHIDCCKVVPATVDAVIVVVVTFTVVDRTAADADIDCTAADFVRPHFASVVIIDSSVIVYIAVKVALTLFAMDIVVAKMALLEE
jgi:hypothetical protein